MRKMLVLVRHGKALQATDGQADFDRELSKAGKRSLNAKLPQMLAQFEPGRAGTAIWASPSARSMQTAKLLASALEARGVRMADCIEEHDSLWDQNEDAFLAELPSSPEDVVFAVGHNPFVEELAFRLTGARIPCSPGGFICIDVDYPDDVEDVQLPNAGTSQLLWFSQGPVSQHWKTLVQLENTLKEASDTVESRRKAFFEDPDDIETMHKFRVSIRTLRSLVAFIKPWQEAEQNALSQSLLRDVVACTSRLRELDVFSSQAKDSSDASGELVAFCENEARGERKQVSKVLQSKTMRKKLDKALSQTRSIKWKRSVAAEGLPPETIRKRFDALAEKLEGDVADLRLSEAEQTHDVRKRAKRVRYAAESFKGILGDDAVGIAKGMTSHQDNLGAVCDARVNIGMINGFLERELPEAVAWDLTLLRAQNETFLYSALKADEAQSEAEEEAESDDIKSADEVLEAQEEPEAEEA